MNIVLLIAVTVISATCGFQQQIPLPDGANQALQTTGAEYLGNVITQANKALTDAVEEFKPINASCRARYEEALTSCGSCVKDKCAARAKNVCKPSDLQIILGETVGFITEDIPDFFTDTVPDFFEKKVGGAFVDLGDGIVDVTKDIGNFFEGDFVDAFVNLGDGIEDAATDVGKFVENVVGDIGDAFDDLGDGVVDVAEDIGDFAENVGGEIGNVVGAIGDGASDIIDDIGGALGGLFGRRKRSLRAKRSTQPSCSQIKANATVACRFYLDPDFCVECGFSTAQDCPGYDSAIEKIQAASANREWMSKATSSSYRVVKTLFSLAHLDPVTQGFNGVEVEVHMFGKDLKFTVSQPINPYNSDMAGPIIAEQALELFKSA